jgi:hypothetical protein
MIRVVLVKETEAELNHKIRAMARRLQSVCQMNLTFNNKELNVEQARREMRSHCNESVPGALGTNVVRNPGHGRESSRSI